MTGPGAAAHFRPSVAKKRTALFTKMHPVPTRKGSLNHPVKKPEMDELGPKDVRSREPLHTSTFSRY